MKLPPSELAEALALSGAEHFEPMAGRAMKEWAQIPYSHRKRWPGSSRHRRVRRGRSRMTELLVLGGERVPALAGGTTDVLEPATGAVAWQTAQADADDAARAVDIAARAFEDGAWQRLSARERGRVLTRASFLIRDRQEELARLEARNGGKPIGNARAEIDIVAERLRVLGRRGEQDHRRDDPDRPAGHRRHAARAGRRVRADHAVELPGGDRQLEDRARARLWQHRDRQAGLADAAVGARDRRPPHGSRAAGGNPERAPGPGATTAMALVRDPRVAKVSFTGSTEVGTTVMQAAATNITRVSLELGGKSANVVFDDADLDAAIVPSLWSVFDNTGQDCCARSRQFVQRGVTTSTSSGSPPRPTRSSSASRSTRRRRWGR